MNNKFCPKCENEIKDETNKCENCGFDFVNMDSKPKNKRKPLIIVIAAVFVLLAGGFLWSIVSVGGNFSEAATIISHGSISCFNEHDWIEATCTEAKHCKKCGFSEGEKTEHEWVDGTCTEPMKCKLCGETKGEPLGHEWIKATCTEPSVCDRCGETKGNALGHTYVDYICTTCGDVSYSYDDVKNIIEIDNLRYFTIGDSAYHYMDIKNCMSARTIKYVYLTIEFYNAVGDVLQNEDDGAYSMTVEYTGPLGPGETVESYDFGSVFHNRNFDGTINYLECEIIYMDGTSIVLDKYDCLSFWENEETENEDI